MLLLKLYSNTSICQQLCHKLDIISIAPWIKEHWKGVEWHIEGVKIIHVSIYNYSFDCLITVVFFEEHQLSPMKRGLMLLKADKEYNKNHSSSNFWSNNTNLSSIFPLIGRKVHNKKNEDHSYRFSSSCCYCDWESSWKSWIQLWQLEKDGRALRWMCISIRWYGRKMQENRTIPWRGDM